MKPLKDRIEELERKEREREREIAREVQPLKDHIEELERKEREREREKEREIARQVQPLKDHYWCTPVSAIIGPNQFLPLLVRTRMRELTY